MTSYRVTFLLVGISAILAMGPSNGCDQQAGREAAKTPAPQAAAPTVAEPQPSEVKAATTQPAATKPAETPKPTTAPATQPEAVVPKSTYSSEPPYPVSLFVKDPAEKQPGWLRIDGLVESKQMGTATGTFPEQNRIYVETNNVNRIRIHVTHLPLRPNERVVLQIDKQGMVISRSRPFTTLERLATGEWVVVKEKDK